MSCNGGFSGGAFVSRINRLQSVFVNEWSDGDDG